MTTHLYLASPLHLVNFEELPRQHKELLFSVMDFRVRII